MNDWEEMDELDKMDAEETINVGELIDFLKKYPRDMKIITTWETTTHSLKKENIYISVKNTLFIDCDNNSYKHVDARDPKENEAN